MGWYRAELQYRHSAAVILEVICACDGGVHSSQCRNLAAFWLNLVVLTKNMQKNVFQLDICFLLKANLQFCQLISINSHIFPYIPAVSFHLSKLPEFCNPGQDPHASTRTTRYTSNTVKSVILCRRLFRLSPFLNRFGDWKSLRVWQAWVAASKIHFCVQPPFHIRQQPAVRVWRQTSLEWLFPVAEVPLIKTNEGRRQASADHHEVFVNVSLSNGSQIFLLTYICGRRDAGCRFDDDDAPDVTWLICTTERRQESVRVCGRDFWLPARFVYHSRCLSVCVTWQLWCFSRLSVSWKVFFFFFFRCRSQTELLQSVPSPTSDRREAIEVAGKVCVCEITALYHVSIN